MKFRSISTLSVLLIYFLATSCEPKNSKSSKSQTDKNIVEVEILSLIKIADTTDHYSLTFGVRADTSKKLTMSIGKWEAQALAITLEKMKPVAPLPLDLFEDAITKFGYYVKEVVIDSLVKEIYTAKIICTNGNKTIELKARTADAATMASKFKCPIYIAKKLLTE